MSRFFLIASLMTAFTSFSASASAQRFSQPPPHAGATADRDIYRVGVVDRAKVRAKLAANRADNLARFQAYQQAGVFPSNTYDARKLNVWIDADGRLCAAATIIKASGHGMLVTKIGEQNNFIRLADVKQGPLMDWILTSGLTQDEIVAIQEPFEGVGDEPNGRMAPRTVDLQKRRIEDNRLRNTYKAVAAQIVKNQAASLDAATDRLMKNPSLASTLLRA
jgi:hypothetical protein